MARKKLDDTPPGGWLGPPPTDGLKALSIGVGKHNKKVKQTPADIGFRKKWEDKLKKADSKGKWRWKLK